MTSRTTLFRRKPEKLLRRSFVPDIVAEAAAAKAPLDPGRLALIDCLEALPGRVCSPGSYDRFAGSASHDALTPRERADLQRLWAGYTPKPGGGERQSSNGFMYECNL